MVGIQGITLTFKVRFTTENNWDSGCWTKQTCGTSILLITNTNLHWSQFKFFHLPPGTNFYTQCTTPNLYCVAWQRKNLVPRSRQMITCTVYPKFSYDSKAKKEQLQIYKINRGIILIFHFVRIHFAPFLLVQFLKVISFLLCSIVIMFCMDDAFKFCLIASFTSSFPLSVPETLKKVK